MGRAIDATGIQFKLLNRSRGPAVWSPRAQADKRRYSAWVKGSLEAVPNIHWIFGRAGRILSRAGMVTGLELETGERFTCPAVVVTTGTFLNGLVHIGPEQRPSGRAGEPPSCELAESLKGFGFRWGRLKTGTPPRLHRTSIDFSRFHAEHGDQPPAPFSFQTDAIDRPQIACHLLHTTERVHDLVRANIGKSPLFNGQIRGIGPRLLPVSGRQGHALSSPRAPSDFSGAGGTGRRRNLRQRVLDEPARRRPGGARPVAPRPRGRRHAPSRLRGRVRLHPADGAPSHARGAAAFRTLPRGADQRHVGLRGGGRAGSGGRRERRQGLRGWPPSRLAATRPTSASWSTT